ALTLAFYTHSLHDALPLCVSSTTLAFDGPLARRLKRDAVRVDDRAARSLPHYRLAPAWVRAIAVRGIFRDASHFLSEGNTPVFRSEEHTSELQSRENVVCR